MKPAESCSTCRYFLSLYQHNSEIRVGLIAADRHRADCGSNPARHKERERHLPGGRARLHGATALSAHRDGVGIVKVRHGPATRPVAITDPLEGRCYGDGARLGRFDYEMR